MQLSPTCSGGITSVHLSLCFTKPRGANKHLGNKKTKEETAVSYTAVNTHTLCAPHQHKETIRLSLLPYEKC